MSATLTINIQAIKNNIAKIRELLSPSCKYCFVAKANCYGFGIEVCSRVEEDVDMFAVSSADEFLELRKLVSKPILILDPVYDDIEKLAVLGAIFTISNRRALQVLADSVMGKRVKTKIFLAVNTGMNRFGTKDEKELKYLCRKIKKTQNISVLGVFSHYFDAKNEIFAKTQIEKFNLAKQISDSFFGKNLIYSISSTGGLYLETFDMARVGIGNYSDAFFATLTLKSKVLEIQNLEVGETAGYGAVFTARRKTKLAVVGFGYGDGLPRRILGFGQVLIKGYYCKIVAVCMDSVLVDITDVPAKISDEVVIIGKCKDKQIFICDVARWCDTIIYEIIVNISSRVKRIYTEEKACKSLRENTEQEN